MTPDDTASRIERCEELARRVWPRASVYVYTTYLAVQTEYDEPVSIELPVIGTPPDVSFDLDRATSALEAALAALSGEPSAIVVPDGVEVDAPEPGRIVAYQQPSELEALRARVRELETALAAQRGINAVLKDDGLLKLARDERDKFEKRCAELEARPEPLSDEERDEIEMLCRDAYHADEDKVRAILDRLQGRK